MPFENFLAPASAFPQLAPKATTDTCTSREEINRRKSSSKSRNGCITCKGRRIKCDETKPACNQCTRRRFKCGGYKKDIRFRNVVRPLAARGQPMQGRSPPHQYVQEIQSATTGTFIREQTAAWSRREPSPNILSWPFATVDNALAIDFSNLHPGLSWASSHTELCLLETDPVTFQSSTSQELPNNISRADEATASLFDLNLDALLPSPFPSPSEEPPESMLDASPGSNDDQMESLAALFHEQTCRSLSLRDNTDDNPWEKLMWPMAQNSKALFHAVAGMTCMLSSTTDPSARRKGLLYVQESKSLFQAELNDGSMAIESALATAVAIGFAETWNCEGSTTHANVKNARTLMRQALTRIPPSLSTTTSPRLNFLFNTCIYMDVMGRLTSECGTGLNSHLDQLEFQASNIDGEDMDPLMGYATTLFPVIGHVGDLIGEIRARVPKRNSPAIISRAIELRKTIETWAPTIDLEQVEEPTSNMSDAIQTAEAYRWSTLLLLQQAVPELPNLGSVGELGQRTLVYLATIPMTSQTIIVHTYPLMVAGTEALDEDRDFVRERWQCMSKRMVRGNLNRCLEITEEVWQRRDAYLTRHGFSIQANLSRTQLSSPIPITRCSDEEITVQRSDDCSSSPDLPSERPALKRNSSISNHFPISAAFRKGVDSLTRSGNVEYTVKGQLHWLGVMKDWGCEIYLG